MRRNQRRGHIASEATCDPQRAFTAEFAEKFRRGAGILFPLPLLMHLLFTYGAWPWIVKPSLALAAVLVVIGWAFRYVRRAVVVLAVGSVYLWLFFVHTLGIAPTVGYLVLSDQRAWLPWGPLTSATLLLAFLALRVRLDLVRDWSRPLDETPGVVVDRAQASLRRAYGTNRQDGLTRGGVAIAVVLGPLVFFSHGGPMYLFVVFVLGGHCIALLATRVVAWWVAYLIAVRRWEHANALRLRLPSVR